MVEYEKLYDENRNELTELGKKALGDIQGRLEEKIEIMINQYNIDPIELSFMISNYSGQKCMQIAGTNYMENEFNEMVDNAEPKNKQNDDPLGVDNYV